MARWMTLAVLLLALGGIATPYADPAGARPTVPPRSTEGPDIRAKAEQASLWVRFPATYPPVPQGVEGSELR